MEMNMNCYDKCWNCAWVVWWDCYDYENVIDIYIYVYNYVYKNVALYELYAIVWLVWNDYELCEALEFIYVWVLICAVKCNLWYKWNMLFEVHDKNMQTWSS